MSSAAAPCRKWTWPRSAIRNLWLAARAEGLGMGWVSFFDPSALAELLGIPPGGKQVALLCRGHVEAFYPCPLLESAGWEQRRTMEDLVFENYWNRRAFGRGDL